MPPSKLKITTSSLQRLVKEEASYHQELAQQEARIKHLEENPGSDENAEYQLRQERQAVYETKKVLPTVRAKIADAIKELEALLETNKAEGGEAPTEEVTKAKEAIAEGRKAMREIS
ncbi:tubulin binding cofactor A [Westerdykella ornata]|uniref:Tubulin-specific chaperone A n=1 Tax=Westerdykella ornata TaxID=318751 RepID=A0A6A6J6Z1_WESOR|nr:tubulin binding cofactor A [Westerdykella ornata]KAF2272182.1 tubulin binding cofactor A [Westerdykella ornata]